jgi:sugar lactone lactonase YvrE
MAQAQVVVEEALVIGECPVYDETRNLLFYIGVLDQLLQTYNISTNERKSFNMGQLISFFVLTKSRDGAIVGLVDGIGHIKFEYGKDRNGIVGIGPVEKLCNVEADLPNTMVNDGKCDPNGILWAGTCARDYSPTKQGALYSFIFDEGTKKLTAVKQVGDISLSNGIAWNKAGTIMYYIDSFESAISAFDYVVDDQKPTLSNRRHVWKIPTEWGQALPDGMTIDDHDKLWVAIFGGSRVARIDPEKSGDQVLFVVDVPGALIVTSQGFAGKDLTDLYITTGTVTLDEKTRQVFPKSGCLFVANVQGGLQGARGTLNSTFLAL